MTNLDKISRAIKIVRDKWKLEYNEDKEILELFKKAAENKPPIPPYHIPHLNIDFLEHLRSKEIVIENKFDGTHIQISKFGIFNHSGKQIAEDQLAMLLHLSTFDEFQEVLDNIENHVFGIEVFGRKYTPGGFHKDHEKQLDFVIFDVGIKEDQHWFWDYEKKLKFKKIVKTEKIRVGDPEDIFRRIAELSMKEEFFEGCVVKYYSRDFIEGIKSYRVFGGLYIAKYKGKEYAKAPKEFKGREDLFDEILNELKKLKRPVTKEEKQEISSKIVEYIFSSHPELVQKYKLKKSRLDAMVKKVINWYIQELLVGKTNH